MPNFRVRGGTVLLVSFFCLTPNGFHACYEREGERERERERTQDFLVAEQTTNPATVQATALWMVEFYALCFIYFLCVLCMRIARIISCLPMPVGKFTVVAWSPSCMPLVRCSH